MLADMELITLQVFLRAGTDLVDPSSNNSNYRHSLYLIDGHSDQGHGWPFHYHHYRAYHTGASCMKVVGQRCRIEYSSYHL